MEGTAIRAMRRRLGLTQRQLADRLDVDQGTVSRWERGLERPRPARQAHLQNLMLRDDERRHLARSLAIVRNDLMTSTLLDSRVRLTEASASARARFRKRGVDPSTLIGVSFDRYAERSGCPELPDHLRDSGLLTGDAVLFRFTVNNRGAGHTTLWEPILEGGELVGILNYVASSFAFPANEDWSLERVDAVPANGSPLLLFHEGDRARFIPV